MIVLTSQHNLYYNDNSSAQPVLTRASVASTVTISQFALEVRMKAACSSPSLAGRSAVYLISPEVCHTPSTFCLGWDTGQTLSSVS